MKNTNGAPAERPQSRLLVVELGQRQRETPRKNYLECDRYPLGPRQRIEGICHGFSALSPKGSESN